MNNILQTIRRNELLFTMGREVRDVWSYAKGSWYGTFAQHGEDAFLDNYFKGQPNGFYVDIGASHPFRISNTYRLYKRGWSGVTVEPIGFLGKLHRRWRPRDTLVPKAIGPEPGSFTFYEMIPSVLSTIDAETAHRYTAEGKATILRAYDVDVITPGQLLSDYIGDRRIDFMSMDMEGMDVRTLAAMDLEAIRPRLACVEVNNSAEREAVLKSFVDRGYRQVTELGCNVFVQDARI